MMDKYIRKQDIFNLLESSSDVDGMINKKDFQLAVTRLKEYRKPKSTTPKNTRINYIDEHISSISNYLLRVKEGVETSPLIFPEYLKDILKVSKRTVQRWEKSGIIEKSGVYYDLSDIKKRLKLLKTSKL